MVSFLSGFTTFHFYHQPPLFHQGLGECKSWVHYFSGLCLFAFPLNEDIILFCYHWTKPGYPFPHVQNWVSNQLVVASYVNYRQERVFDLLMEPSARERIIRRWRFFKRIFPSILLLAFLSLLKPHISHSPLFYSLYSLPPFTCAFICSSSFRWLWWSVLGSSSPGPPMWLWATGACFTHGRRATCLPLSACYLASLLRAPPYTTLSFTSSSSVPPGKSFCASRDWCFVVLIEGIYLQKAGSLESKWSKCQTPPTLKIRLLKPVWDNGRSSL